MVIQRITAFLFLIIFCAGILFSDGFGDGYLRLILDEKGTFSLYYLTNPRERLYEPLFYSVDPSTSSISVMVNDTVYRPAQSRLFMSRIETPHGQPSLVFESSFMHIRQIFTPVKTPNSDTINGIQLTTIIHNKRNTEAFIGLRILLDTSLGEARGRIPFITNNQLIQKETIIDSQSDELFWISRGANASLMGSIIHPIDPSARRPDYLHFANWKRLHDSDWDLRYIEGRNFNYLPYSVNDSAVCYYFLPVVVGAGESISLSIVLTTDDPDWYTQLVPPVQQISAQRPQVPPPPPAPPPQIPEPAPQPQEPSPPQIQPQEASQMQPQEASQMQPQTQEQPQEPPQMQPQEPPHPPSAPVSLPLHVPLPDSVIREPEIAEPVVLEIIMGEPVIIEPVITDTIPFEPVIISPVVITDTVIIEPEIIETILEIENADESETLHFNGFAEPISLTDYPNISRADLEELYRLQNVLQRFIDGEIVLSENDLLEIERAINRLKTGH